MKVYQFSDISTESRATFATIGNFDGVHRGHRALIAKVVAEAEAEGAASTLVTFQPHTVSVLKDHRVPILTSLPHRLRLFEQSGLDRAVIIPFSMEIAKKSAESFLQEYLLTPFSLKKLVIGYDFAFGKDRGGSAAVLEQYSISHGFDVEVFPVVMHNGVSVSSSAIRDALQAADFKLARDLLGRPYSVLEEVREGRRQGRELGFPTANQVPEEPLPIQFGVYACHALHGGKRYDGVANYGIRPTVGSEKPLLETYIFEFSENIYGELLEVELLHKIRDERKFESLDALKSQIALDRNEARDFLAGQG